MKAEPDVRSEYLRRLRGALDWLEPAERDSVVREIESHFSEASAAGQPTAIVLARLGAPERLARAYAAETSLQRPNWGWLRRYGRAAAFVATMSAVSLLLVPSLVVLAVGFAVSGVIGIGAGLLAFAFSPEAIRMSPPTPEGAAAAIALGIAFIEGAVLSARALRAYVRFAARSYRRALEVRMNGGA